MSEQPGDNLTESTPAPDTLSKRFEAFLLTQEQELEATSGALPDMQGVQFFNHLEDHFTREVGAYFTKLHYDPDHEFHNWAVHSERSEKCLDEVIDCAYAVASAFASAALAASPHTAAGHIRYDRPRIRRLILILQIAIKNLRRESERRQDRSSYDVDHST